MASTVLQAAISGEAGTAVAGLQVRNLETVRDDRVLFSGLGFDLEPGQVVQVEGPNGCGKTTLLRTVCGFVWPEEGEIRWQGEDIRRCRLEYQASLAYLGHNNGIKEELTPVENLLVARNLGQARADADLVAALERIGLRGYEDVASRNLSAGQRRRVALARLLVTDAPFWILDEPFTALDRRGVGMVEAMLRDHTARGGMAMISTHHPVELPAHTVRLIHLGG